MNKVAHVFHDYNLAFSSKFRISSKSVKRFRRCGGGGRNLPIPIDLAIGLYNSLYYSTSRDVLNAAVM